MKQNDTRPALVASLTDANDQAVNLPGATVVFNMRVEPAGPTKVSASAATVLASEAREVSYSWSAANTDTADDYEAEFQVTYAGGGIQTFPGRNHILVHIVDDIA